MFIGFTVVIALDDISVIAGHQHLVFLAHLIYGLFLELISDLYCTYFMRSDILAFIDTSITTLSKALVGNLVDSFNIILNKI